jgi:hypothetical protein
MMKNLGEAMLARILMDHILVFFNIYHFCFSISIIP